MVKKPKEDPDLKYVEELNAGETEQLRAFFESYGPLCIDGGGSPRWARATCKLVVELLDRLEELDPKKFYKGFRVGERVALTKEIWWCGTLLFAGTEGVIVTCLTPEDKLWDFDVIFDIEALSSTPVYVDAHEIRKVEDD